MMSLRDQLDQLADLYSNANDDADALAGEAVHPPGFGPRELAETAIAMMDLTTLEATDTPSRVRELCRTAKRPDDDACPPVAAVCIYPDLVPAAAYELAGSPVRVASVAGAFPAGRAPLHVKLSDARSAINAGADEIDVVMDRGAFLEGNEQAVFDHLRAMKDLTRTRAGADVLMKVILETGELGLYSRIHRASWLAMLAGADFIKTSTGKIDAGACLPAVIVMLRAVRDFEAHTDRHVGVKASGGIRRAEDAARYMAAVHAVAGSRALSAERFRFGASSLLRDLLEYRARAATPG